VTKCSLSFPEREKRRREIQTFLRTVLFKPEGTPHKSGLASEEVSVTPENYIFYTKESMCNFTKTHVSIEISHLFITVLTLQHSSKILAIHL
jgi:hypothetical protein